MVFAMVHLVQIPRVDLARSMASSPREEAP